MKPTLFTILLIMLLLGSCKKGPSTPNDSVPPNPPTELVEANPRIAVKLNANYLAASKLDSAVLQWEVNGQVKETIMQLSNDTLFVPIKLLSKGTGLLTIQLFSSIELQWRHLQFEQRMELTITDHRSVNMVAPTDFNDKKWMPRAIMPDDGSSLVTIIGIRPEDPYFLLKNVPPGYKIELDRIYMRIPGGAQILAGGTWKCNAVCTDAKGNIENREFFKPLAAQMAGKEWRGYNAGVGFFGPNYTSGPIASFAMAL